MISPFKGRNIRPFRFIVQILAVFFVYGQIMGLPPFGTLPIFRRIFLPNASCRYISDAPTSCYYYQVQDGLTSGWATHYVDVAIIVAVVILMIIALGRFWCSWLCPFGLVQEGLDKSRELLRIPRLRLNLKQRIYMRRIKYALIFLTILISIPIGISALGLSACSSTFTLPFCQVCPAKGFFTILGQVTGREPWSTELPILAIGSLVLFLGSSMVLPMAFCRICPMGGLMALFGGVSLPVLKKDPSKCTSCRICTRVCPLDHDRVYEDLEKDDVGGEDCTLCGKCVEYCPEEGCLSLNYGTITLKSSRRPRNAGVLKRSRKGKGGRSG